MTSMPSFRSPPVISVMWPSLMPGVTATGKPSASGGIVSSLVPRMPSNRTRSSAAAGASTAAARQVWVLPEGGDGTAVAVAVTPGISDGRMTEIVAGELRAGMQVITDQKAAAAK